MITEEIEFLKEFFFMLIYSIAFLNFKIIIIRKIFNFLKNFKHSNYLKQKVINVANGG